MGEIPAPPPVPPVSAPGSFTEPESPNLPPPVPGGAKKSSKTWIIVLVIVIILCCLCSCAAAGIYLWNNGDQIMNEMNIETSLVLPFLV
jgi:hypothetical protein